MILIALLAVLIPIILLGVLNLPARTGMTISAVVVAITGFIFWKIPFNVILASTLQGIHKTLPILWILFGALMLLNVLKKTGAITSINNGFKSLTLDMRLQGVLVAYLFGALIEGVSGFGTPAMVTAPLLIALGFSPLSAVVLALVSNSNPAVFGAVGTPITVGLSNVAQEQSGNVLNQVSQTITTLDLMGGIFIPTILVFLMTVLLSPKDKRIGDWLEVLPWTLFIGACYSGFSWLYSNLLSYEFVSIVTPLTMLVVTMLLLRFNFLLPKKSKIEPWRKLESESFVEPEATEESMSLIKAWLPYGIVVVLLLLTRTIPALTSFLNEYVNLSWNDILGYKTINSDWAVLYSPGFVLTLVSILALLIQVKSLKMFIPTAKEAFSNVVTTGITLSVTLIMVQIFSNSGINNGDLASMPAYIAEFLSKYLSNFWLFIAPFIGELGTFITGSVTVSNLTFGTIQADVAADSNLPTHLILAGQAMGAAAGSMICIFNIVAVSSVVGLFGKEGEILRKTMLPALIYTLLIVAASFVYLQLM
ncbi:MULTISPECIES: L-lactate permease [unclassified Lactococcus]|uniref:L-lactate permease n=1 Tax=unclassified Lactococcus TaxID=2643510 RepID=UPI0011CC25A7|nr:MULTISPECIES: L-lactate permease [unclassified Lactococcus]MQW22347.1 L-lactate permease [Lactococcus sp. dk101]TXK45385.1 L-lactate permease [Lactococcus sp. dk310]TXK51718.1 L-lactate permease [Lactococcus sp. dk322]